MKLLCQIFQNKKVGHKPWWVENCNEILSLMIELKVTFSLNTIVNLNVTHIIFNS